MLTLLFKATTRVAPTSVLNKRNLKIATTEKLGGVCEVILSPFPPYNPMMTPAYPPYFESEKKSEEKKNNSECTKEKAS